MSQGRELTLERSLYPRSQLFKPKRIDATSVRQALLAYKEILAQPVPHTREDVAYSQKSGWPLSEAYAGDSFDDETTKDWVKKGIYWERIRGGSHPGCHSLSRVGATVWWRNSYNSYSCAGFPRFLPETMEKFRKTMEMIKPLMALCLDGNKILISLERTLKGAEGDCWGITTAERYLRIGDGWGDLPGKRIPFTFAALDRELLKTMVGVKHHEYAGKT